MDPTLYKDVVVPRGFTYHYYHSPAVPGKPTLLFLHGYPSSSYDWHRQVAYFQPQGRSHSALAFVALAQDIVDLLDAARVGKVVGIAHDWGSVVLSRLSSLHSERFEGFAWLALGYMPVFSALHTLARAMSSMKSDVPGYWSFLAEEDTYLICEKNIDSFIQLVYSVTPETWVEWLIPEGKAKEYVEGNRLTGRPHWLSQEEYNTIRDILVQAGLKSRNIYYTTAFSNANIQSDSKIPQEAMAVQRPALFIAAARDVVCLASVSKTVMAQYAPHAKVVEIDIGHWLQFEATEQVNNELEVWLDTLL
ncbi:alpha/beta-hydrolase [Cubamyces lactineus]|nr:alpha/beta-hydrolase [Cubamyces lactineus]